MNQSRNDPQNSSPIQNLDLYFTSSKIYHIVTALILMMACYFFFRQPIYSISDTDLWYHLSSGRYLAQFKEIPNNGTFSFIAGSREWSNYYWLFQCLVYRVYAISGYYDYYDFTNVTTTIATTIIITTTIITIIIIRLTPGAADQAFQSIFSYCFH